MPIFGERPHTSITVKVNQLAQSNRNEDVDDTIELYLSDLLDLISIQPGSGAAEAARAIRKKVKYGDTVGEQIRALNILELLVLNSGPKIGPVLARDDKLIDVLKGILLGHAKTGVGLPYENVVRQKVMNLAIGWKSELNGLDGYKYFAMLWQYIPKNKSDGRHTKTTNENVFDSYEDTQRSPKIRTPKVRSDEFNDFRSPKADNYRSPPPRPKTQSPYAKPRKDKKSKKSKKPLGSYADRQFEIGQINYKVEAPKITNIIASSQTHTTTLNNILISLPPNQSPLDSAKATLEFEKLKSIRRKVLRYLQYVGAGDSSNKTDEVLEMDERFLGTLIDTNESLVATLKRFDAKCGYTVDDPAPSYNNEDEEDSDDSYYTDESSDEENVDLVSERLQDATIGTSSSSSILHKSPPPPRPNKPLALSQLLPPKPLKETHTNSSMDEGEDDPFGDSSAVSKSIYD